MAGMGEMGDKGRQVQRGWVCVCVRACMHGWVTGLLGDWVAEKSGGGDARERRG